MGGEPRNTAVRDVSVAFPYPLSLLDGRLTPMVKRLFHDKDLRARIEHVRQSVLTHVEGVPEDQFLSSPPQQVRGHLLSMLKLDHLVIYEDLNREDAQAGVACNEGCVSLRPAAR